MMEALQELADAQLPSIDVINDKIYIYTINPADERKLEQLFMCEDINLPIALKYFGYSSFKEYVVDQRESLYFLSVYITRDKQRKDIIPHYFNDYGYKEIRANDASMEIKTSAIRPLNYVSFPMNCLYLFEDRYNVVYLRGRLALVKLVSSINVEEDAYTCVARGELDQLARLVENEKFASFEDFLAKFFNGEKDLTKIIKKYSWEEFHYDPESDMLILLMSLGEFRERLKFEISKKDYLFDLIDTYSRKIINTPWNDDNRQATVIKESKRKLDKANIKPIKKKRLSSSSSDDCPIVQTEKTSKIHGIFNSLIQLEEEEKLKSVDNLEASAVDKPNDNGENTIRNIKRCMVQDDPSPNDDLLQKGIANMSINQVSEKDMSTDFPSSQLDPEIAISRTYNTIFDKLDEYMINNPATNSISDPTISTISRIEEQEIIEKEALKVDDVQDAVDRKPPVYPPVTNVNLPEDIDPIYNHAFESNIYDNVFV